MYAVIRTGGKQYRVAPDDVIEVEKLSGAAGETVEFGEVLMVGGDGAPKLGAPTVSGASVAGEVLEQKRGQKIVVFKKKRRQNYRRTAGHRQYLTAVRITEILTGGKKPSKTAAEKGPAKKESASGTKKASSSGKTAKTGSAKAESKTGAAKTGSKAKAGKGAASGQAASKKAEAGKTATKKTASGTGAAKKAEGAAGGGTKKAAAKKPAAKKTDEKPDKD